MSNRINKTIADAQKDGRVAFIGLVPIEPDGMEHSHEIVDVMVKSGGRYFNGSHTKLDSLDGRKDAPNCGTGTEKCWSEA